MRAIIEKELKLIRKDKRSFFFLLLMPVLFIVMFSLMYSGGGHSSSISLHVIDQDQTATSQAFLGHLEKIMDVQRQQATV